MIARLLLLQVFLLCWSAAVRGAPQDLNSIDYDYYDPNPSYDFAWEVNNKETFDEKSQQETLKDGTVEGSYSYLRPDGKMQIVNYRANDDIGFVVNIETIDVTEPFGAAGRPKSADTGFSSGGSSKVLSNAAAYSASTSFDTQSSQGTSTSFDAQSSQGTSRSFSERRGSVDSSSSVASSNTFSSNSNSFNLNKIQSQSTLSSSQNQKSKQQSAEAQLLNRQIQAQKEREQAQTRELARLQEQKIRLQQQQKQQQQLLRQQQVKQQQRQQQVNTQQQFNQRQQQQQQQRQQQQSQQQTQQQFQQKIQSNQQQNRKNLQQQQIRQQNQHQEVSHQIQQQQQQQQDVTLKQTTVQNQLKQQVPQKQQTLIVVESENEVSQVFGKDVRKVLGQPVKIGTAKQPGSQVRPRTQARAIPGAVIPFPAQASNVGLNQSPVILARPTLNRASRPSTTNHNSPSFTTKPRTQLSSLSTTTRTAPSPPSRVEPTKATTLIPASPTLAPIVNNSRGTSNGKSRSKSQNSKIVNTARQLNQQRKLGSGVAYVSFNSPTHEYSYPFNH